MTVFDRWLTFIVGTMIQSAGIELVVKSTLGTSPISSLPYVMSLTSPFTFGQTTFVVNILMLVGQIALLRRRFDRLQLLQIPVTFVFAAVLDVAAIVLSSLNPETYSAKLIVLLLGAMLVSIGIALAVIANVLMLPGEAIVKAISTVSKINFGTVKTAFDCSLVSSAALWSLLGLGYIEGVREGTLISALITGSMARFFISHLSRVDKHGNRSLHFRF